jgi:hypothetical protein
MARACRTIHSCLDHTQGNWEYQEGNQLINEQRAHNRQEQQAFVDRGLPTLNPQQRALYHAVMDSVIHSNGSMFFLHSGGGCGKTDLAKLIAAAVRARGEIALCVASTGLASLLLPGCHTAHSRFKIPISCHEQSTCNIKKDDLNHQLLQQTSLIIWDEAGSQHHDVVESVDHTLCDLLNRNQPFGGITILFGEDFRQILPVVQHGSRELIVPATFTHSNLWANMSVHYLLQNICLGQDPESAH